VVIDWEELRFFSKFSLKKTRKLKKRKKERNLIDSQSSEKALSLTPSHTHSLARKLCQIHRINQLQSSHGTLNTIEVDKKFERATPRVRQYRKQ